MYSALMRGDPTEKGARFTRLAAYFDAKFNSLEEFSTAESLSEFLQKVLNAGFTVSIEMGSGDNICAVFSSINGKGCPLKPIDLLKNLVLMRSEVGLTEAYERFWAPVEEGMTTEELERLFRKIVLAMGGWCSSSSTLDRFNELFKGQRLQSVIDTLLLWKRQQAALTSGLQSRGYDTKTVLAFERIRRARGFMQDTSHLLIEGSLVMLEKGSISESEFRRCLVAIENFVVRISMHDRQMTRDATAIMHKVLPLKGEAAVQTLTEALLDSPSYIAATDETLIALLQAKAFKSQTLRWWARYVLLGIDAYHNSDVSYQEPSLEHVAPQKITGAMHWGHLASNAEVVHRLGNLTILKNAWNEEIRRASFPEKQSYFSKSRLWLNDCFSEKVSWTAADIAERTEDLLQEFLTVWPYKRLVEWQ